jgi:hypothetical protein
MRGMIFAALFRLAVIILATAMASLAAAAADPPSRNPPDEAAVRALIGPLARRAEQG